MANIERVVALMNENGIATSMVNRRAWQRDEWKRFSYTKPAAQDTWPQIWVVHSNDQTRARQLLRDAGLEPPVRYAEELADYRRPETRSRALAVRIKTALLAVIAVVIGLIAYSRFS